MSAADNLSVRLMIGVVVVVCCSMARAATVTIANSNVDFTATGLQGTHNHWHHGYYNLTADGDGTYQASDFAPFTNSAGPGGGPVSAGGNHWDGSAWDLSSSGAPWTRLGNTYVHPNGTNNGSEHHVIRRWVSPYAAILDVSWTMTRTADGNGVEGFLYHNGTLIDTSLSPVSTARVVSALNVQPGDTIDLALGPNGADSSDSSNNQLTIAASLDSETQVAHSQNELSGTQGQNNWYYGYWDKTADGDKIYAPGELTQFLPAHWTGSKWDLGANAPWTEITDTGGHPQGSGNAHWAIRRWESEVAGTVHLAGTLNNPSASGDGTIGRIFVDGVEIYARLTDGNSFGYSILADVNVGSQVDFVIDAGLANDQANDGTTFTAIIDHVTVVPEPATLTLAAIGLVGWRRRRNR